MSPQALQHKILYLVRHAEAAHNVKEKEAQAEARRIGCSDSEVEEARKRALTDPQFLDASLSGDGHQQVTCTAECFQQLLGKTHYCAPDVVFVSPLTRALQTASELFPEHPDMRAMEFLREKRTGEACDERKSASAIRLEFPHVETSDIARVDAISSDGYCFRDELREGNQQVAERATTLLDFARSQEGSVVAVVTHKGFLRELSRGPLQGVLDIEGSHLPTVFGNAEVRVCEVEWDDKGVRQVIARTLKEITELPPMAIRRLGSWNSDTVERSWPRVWQQYRSEDCELYGGGLHMAVGCSTDADVGAAAAAASAWRTMEERLGGPPTVALLLCHPDMKSQEVASTLRPMAGACCVVGGTSCSGVLTAAGSHNVGVLGLRNFAHRCRIGVVNDITSGQARRSTARAVAKATGGDVPDMIFMCSSPGFEEEILEGIKEKFGDVPVLGGSSAGQLDDPDNQIWWQLRGGMAGWSVFTHGAVFVCLWLFSDANLSSTLSHCFAPTEHKGRITKAVGRSIFEIDRQPAATVLNRWTGGAFQAYREDASLQRLRTCVMPEGRLHPLALSERNMKEPKLACVRAIHENGQVSCFCQVSCGECRMLGLKSSDQPAALKAAIEAAMQKADFQVLGAVISVDAGCVIDVQVLRGVLPDLPEVLCCFMFGQQGMIGDRPVHGNLMINILLFG